MDIQRIDCYTDSRFSQEVLYQHGAFLVDGKPWAFRIISDCEAVVSGEGLDESTLDEVVDEFRFNAWHITSFYTESGTCLLHLPPVKRREVELYRLQPSQFSVDREKCRAVGNFIRSAADLVIPVMTLKDGTLCVLDGHTRLYEAWRRGIRSAIIYDSPLSAAMREQLAGIVREARKRGIYYIRDMALYSPQEQKEKWHDWCTAYFAAQGRTEEE